MWRLRNFYSSENINSNISWNHLYWFFAKHSISRKLKAKLHTDIKLRNLPSLRKYSWKHFAMQGTCIVWKLQKLTLTLLMAKISWKQCFTKDITNTVTMWKSTIKRDHNFYGKIDTFSVKLTFLLKKLLKSWFHEIFFLRDRVFLVFFLTVQSLL